ncbi:T6SS immunity protein Tli3 family protein [Enterobacter oligotrophicus]|uniref:T6SS immunity protein Tli3 family protein n=1 Tax=Enterobacter oligotrophicus TaxID=2478464 RepID=UPI003C6C2F86
MIKRLLSGLILMVAVNSQARQLQEPPTQVVYRFDDHRYLELKGWDCEGELWYIDTQRGIRSEPVSQFYRIFTKKFVHPSERYIAITGWGAGGFMASKDYGKTWQLVQFSPGENEPNGDNHAPYDDIISFTVVNDQGFLQTKHSLYMSSKPFDDPRVVTGGPGIPYTASDGSVGRLEPGSAGEAWGMVYMTKRALVNSIHQFKSNYQNMPDAVPEVKNYTGWDHMRCDMDAGK